MRSRFMPRDERGRVYRFASHREAVRWCFLFTAQNFGRRWLLRPAFGVVVLLVAAPFVAGRGPFEDQDAGFVVAAALTFLLGLLLAYPIASSALYLYTALAGGVKSREERRR